MQSTRTWARMLSLALAVLALSLSACSSDETKASVIISKFRVECPALLKTTFSADPTFSSLGDAFTTNLSSDTCSCIATRLRALPPEKVLAFDQTKSPAELETLMSPCSAIAVKSHIGELCMAAVKQIGGDPSVARARCDCVQRKTDEMDDATVESTFANLQQGFTSIAQSCASAG
ncbi:hypothetical protein [Lysobacter brunescens]|uniref:Lipoprotein n=1 Tax=Lysobacter brunescens TaxID=262323 RepID=A0ABW2Y7U1_9GAMM